MQVNWALWQQPIGGNCNYNFPFQSFHCAIQPQRPITWQEQLQQVYQNLLAQQAQQVYQNLLAQHAQQFSSTSYRGFGSSTQPVNCSNYNQTSSSSSVKIQEFTENPSEPSKVKITTPPSDNNNEGTMDPKDFVIPTRFNAFAVNFKNSKALTEDQVHDIFVVYGKIKRVKQTGDEHGLCFVNFEVEEDAINAAAGVKNHPDIRLRPAKLDRSKKSADNNFSSKNSNNGNGNYSNNDNSNSFSNFTNSTNNDNDNYSNGGGKNNFNDTRRNNYSNGDGKNNFNDKRKNNHSNNSNSKIDSPSDMWPSVHSSSELKTSAITEPVEVSVSGSNYDNKQETITTHESFDSSPVSITEPVINHQQNNDSLKSEIQIPDLVPKETRFNSMDSTNSVPLVPIEKMAVEVMVANIPERVNLHKILELLDKYHPLAATNIRIFGPSNMRYCRVYFTSQERAEDVEKEFNNCVLMGKPLLVIRASRLVN